VGVEDLDIAAGDSPIVMSLLRDELKARWELQRMLTSVRSPAIPLAALDRLAASTLSVT